MRAAKRSSESLSFQHASSAPWAFQGHRLFHAEARRPQENCYGDNKLGDDSMDRERRCSCAALDSGRGTDSANKHPHIGAFFKESDPWAPAHPRTRAPAHPRTLAPAVTPVTAGFV